MRQTLRATWTTAILVLLIGSPVWAETYKVDPAHSTVEFRIRHMLSYVRGTFDEFEGTYVYGPNVLPAQWKVTASVNTASIDTRVADRDKHLRSPDFLDVEQFPAMTFTLTEVTDVTPTSAKLHGLLALHGVEKPVAFDLQIHGVVTDPQGKIRSAFTATTKINRQDFGVKWNKMLDTGQLLVGNDVEITLEVEGIAEQ